jgi:transposase-like protein
VVENYGIVGPLKICQTHNGLHDEKKRCTHCHSLNTKKHGFIRRSPLTKRGKIRAKTQRFYCKDCRRSFTSSFSGKRRRHAPELIKEAIVLSIDNHLSLREVAAKLGVSHQSIANWIRKYGSSCLSSAQINQRLKPYWSGVLGIDGKPIKLFAQDYVLLLAVDLATHDAVHCELMEAEDRTNCSSFLLFIRDELRYPLRALVSDMGKGRVFLKLIAQLFPLLPHQLCVTHFLRYVDLFLPRSRKSPYYYQNNFLRQIVTQIVLAGNFSDAEELMRRLLAVKEHFKTSYQKRIIRSLEQHFEQLTVHHFHSDIPRDNNITENIIKQLNKKLKSAECFKAKESAVNYLNLWFAFYKFKKFRASNQPHRNGKSPLELALVTLPDKHWLDYCAKV